MLNYAIVGLGGLGKVHFANANELSKIYSDVKLVAICDVNEETFTNKTATNLGEDNSERSFSAYNLYTDIKVMLEKEKLDFIISAVPSYLHEEIAIMAMEKGIHVFSEKPIALSLEQGKT